MALTRAYSILRIKTVDDEQRIITGTATTPQPDRLGDIVEPLGVTFKNPIPLLLYHDTKRPVGRVKLLAPTEDGVDFEASLPMIEEPGTLRDRVEEAWQSLKAKLITAVSIGFRSIEEAWINETASFRFIKSEILELSLVTIPANANATIANVKDLAARLELSLVTTPAKTEAAIAFAGIDLAARGRNSPGASGTRQPVRALKDAPTMAQKTSEQIARWEATRAAKAAEMSTLMETAEAAGVTLDASQSETYDALAREVEDIDTHLVRLRTLETTNVQRATRIVDTSDSDAAASQRGGRVISIKSNLVPGTPFVRYCRALVIARGNLMQAVEVAKQWRDSTPEVELALKAAVAAGTTTDATWAGPLAQPNPLAAEFLEYLRPATVLGKIPNLRSVPFNVSVTAQTGGGTYQWVGQGAPKPVGKLAFAATILGIAKCSGIIVISEELARVSTPSAEDVIRMDMRNGIAAFLDLEFTDPAKAPVANVSPGSVTNGVALIPSAGPTPANARTDITALAGAMLAANISTAGAVLLMSETNALALSSAQNPLGQALYPGLAATGGTIMGYPAITSQALATNVIMLNGEGILIADEGGVAIDVSREATVQMDSAPANPADATTILTSLWQNNLVGLRAERFINWKRARTGAVQYTQQTYAAA